MKTPEQLVQDQVDAYNARDLEGFLMFYAEEVVVASDGKENTRTKAALRDSYGRLFSANPDLRCSILKREAAGNIVIDDECVDGLADGSLKEVRVTYVIEGGLIRRVSFAPR
jgi:hypothetical protein